MIGIKQTKLSEKLEQRIKRIHNLLEQSGSEITWNDHIPDPDNPEQSRQIDVTIRREEKLTLVECRTHTEKQNVKWIEELIGRRASLRADAIIAVSAVGFTKGAIKKAKAFGVILRDLVTLTAAEISAWGHLTQIWLTFYEFTEVNLVFRFCPEHRSNITIDQVERYLHTAPNTMYDIFEIASNKISEKYPKIHHGKFNAQLSNQKLIIDGSPLINIDFNAKFSLRKESLRIPSVVAYAAPIVLPNKRDVYIEEVEFGEFEITHSLNDVLVTIDLSPIQIPPNCKFHTVEFDFQRSVTIRSLEIIGLPEMQIPLDKLLLKIAPA